MVSFFLGTFVHFRGGSLTTLADLRLKSLELPSRSALAAQLRAERIQRAALARQKQLQRLVRGTRGGYRWGTKIDGEDFKRKVIIYAVEKEVIHSSCVTDNWEFVSWVFLFWPKERICFWRTRPWLMSTSSDPLHTDNCHWLKMAIEISNAFLKLHPGN